HHPRRPIRRRIPHGPRRNHLQRRHRIRLPLFRPRHHRHHLPSPRNRPPNGRINVQPRPRAHPSPLSPFPLGAFVPPFLTTQTKQKLQAQAHLFTQSVTAKTPPTPSPAAPTVSLR